MGDKINVLVTGGEGYLGKEYIEKLKNDPGIGRIVSVDPKNLDFLVQFPDKTKLLELNGGWLLYWEKDNVIHLNLSVLDRQLLQEVMRKFNTQIVAHFGWWFNPTHYLQKQWKVNVEGTKNVLSSAALSGVVKQIVYTGSSTAYGQIPENDHPLKEDEWENHFHKRLSTACPYSRQKAEVDLIFQKFQSSFPGINIFWTRAAIVLGRNTPNNIVAYVAKSPFTFGKYMFKVKGCDPQMQFLSEYDMAQVLYRATMEGWSGPINVAGTGTLPYSEVIGLLGRKQIELPAEMLYKLCDIGWKVRIGDRSLLKFPSSLIDTTRWRWDGDISLLKNKYKYEPQYSSVDAILQFKETFK